MNLASSMKSTARKILGDDLVDKVRTYPRDVRTASIQRELPAKTIEAIKLVKQKRWTFLTDARLARLAQACMKTEHLDGAIVETGCALGGSSIVMAATKRPDRELHIYDVFGQIPPPSERDGTDCHDDYSRIASGNAKGIGTHDTYYGYVENLYDQVKSHFETAGYRVDANTVAMHRGLVEDTLKLTGPVRLAHIDVDWYDPVMLSLQRLEPLLPVGGVIQLDDYFDYSGCIKATDDYFRDPPGGRRYARETWTGALTLTRVS